MCQMWVKCVQTQPLGLKTWVETTQHFFF